LDTDGDLQALERLDGVAEGLVGLGDGVALDDGADGAEEQLDVLDRVVALHLLVEVRVEGDLLDVVRGAHVHERLARAVVGVEDLLQNVQHQVGGACR